MTSSQLPGPRISRAYFSNAEVSAVPEVSGNGFMLWRDVPLGIMPSRSAVRSGARLNVSLLPNHDREQWVVRLLDITRYSQTVLSQAVVRFVEQMAGDLVYSGERFYEIVSASTGEPRETVLVSLPPGEIKQERGFYRQVIPESDRTPGRDAAILIPASRIWHVTIPPAFGTPAKHRAMLASLGRLGPFAKFVLDGERFGADVGYDFGVHRRASDIAVESATRAWGTIPSLQQVAGTTEYYFIARRLQFRRSQATLREHILAELNSLLTRLDASVQVVVEGLPSADFIAEQMARLQEGEIGFKDALDATET